MPMDSFVVYFCNIPAFLELHGRKPSSSGSVAAAIIAEVRAVEVVGGFLGIARRGSSLLRGSSAASSETVLTLVGSFTTEAVEGSRGCSSVGVDGRTF